MKHEFIEDTDENQIASAQSIHDLRVSSDATELDTQVDVVNVVEQCPDVEREWERPGVPLLTN